jgi:WD40 repeat protein
VNKLEISPDKQYLAAAGNPAIRLYEVNTSNPQPVTTFEGHTGNVTAVGFERDGRWMYSGSEDGTVKIWDLRAPGFQREYESRGAVNSVVLHPNQARAPPWRCIQTVGSAVRVCCGGVRSEEQLYRPSLRCPSVRARC